MKEQTLKRQMFPGSRPLLLLLMVDRPARDGSQRISQVAHKIQRFGVCVRPGQVVLIKKTVAQQSRCMYDGAVGIERPRSYKNN